MRFSRKEYWSGLPFPSPEDLPDPGIEPRSPSLQADAFTVGATREAQQCIRIAKPAKWHALNWEMGIDTCTLLILCIKQITSEKPLYSSGNSTALW